ncbi:MAG: TlyA family RNA methyltransferase [Chloroflexi bacterium]|nr:TlyA family RNA methyltransferase [Chloroflexota bacterium]
MPRQRLDVLVVERGLAESREKARSLILAGEVWSGTRVLDKPGILVDAALPLQVTARPLYVGRGGIKLAGALDVFGVTPAGLVCGDLGASTGGFTDVMLQRGAVRVYAVDVGYGQLDYRLRQDARVVSLERVNARLPLPISEPLALITIDVSFISLELVIPSAVRALQPGGQIVALVKPQFEAGRGSVGKGGVVRNVSVHRDVLHRIILWSVNQGLRLRGLTTSPLFGDRGNREFFIWLEKEPSA